MSVEGADPEVVASIIASIRADLAHRRSAKGRSAPSDLPVDEVQMLRAQATQLRAQAAKLLDAAWRAEQRLRLLEELGCTSDSVQTERAAALADSTPSPLDHEGTPGGQQPAHSRSDGSHRPVRSEHS